MVMAAKKPAKADVPQVRKSALKKPTPKAATGADTASKLLAQLKARSASSSSSSKVKDQVMKLAAASNTTKAKQAPRVKFDARVHDIVEKKAHDAKNGQDSGASGSGKAQKRPSAEVQAAKKAPAVVTPAQKAARKEPASTEKKKANSTKTIAQLEKEAAKKTKDRLILLQKKIQQTSLPAAAPVTPPTLRHRMKSPAGSTASLATDASSQHYKEKQAKAEAHFNKVCRTLEQKVLESEEAVNLDCKDVSEMLHQICDGETLPDPKGLQLALASSSGTKKKEETEDAKKDDKGDDDEEEDEEQDQEEEGNEEEQEEELQEEEGNEEENDEEEDEGNEEEEEGNEEEQEEEEQEEEGNEEENDEDDQAEQAEEPEEEEDAEMDDLLDELPDDLETFGPMEEGNEGAEAKVTSDTGKGSEKKSIVGSGSERHHKKQYLC